MNHIRKHKLIIYWLSAITLLSCSGNKENNSESTGQIEKEVAKVIPEIQLETFGYLEEVMGCSCYLAFDSLNFVNKILFMPKNMDFLIKVDLAS
jgi:hypothetical protein